MNGAFGMCRLARLGVIIPLYSPLSNEWRLRLKNRQSTTACSLLHLVFLRISYLTTLGLKMKLSNISVKYSEKTPAPGKFQRLGSIRSKLAELVGGLDSMVTLTLTRSEGQHSGLCLRGSISCKHLSFFCFSQSSFGATFLLVWYIEEPMHQLNS